MVRPRVRIRFRKLDDLRTIGHLDLVRAWERLLRRAGVRLAMSEGFHPKPRMTIPSALALGVAGLHEIVEFETDVEEDAESLSAALAPHAPPGLVIDEIEILPPGAPRPRVEFVEYELPVPHPRRAALADRLRDVLAESTHPIDRGPGRASVDLRATLAAARLDDGVLRLRLRVTQQAAARPRDVLAALEVEDLLQDGFPLTRSAVELTG